MKHFDLGEYRDALEDFKNGYRAKEDPVFLYNIAQCYRLLEQPQDAVRYYRLYLSRAPDAPNRSEIEQRIQTLRSTVVSQPEPPSAATPSTPSAGAPPFPRPVDAKPEVPATTQRSAVRHDTPVYKKWWLWTIVGVAAAGAGVGLGIGLTRSAPSSGMTFPTASF